MDENNHPENMTILARRLVGALRARGLSAEPFGVAMVWAANRAVDDAADRVSPGMRQAVLCRADGERRLGWWWIWTGSDGDPEQEWMCPATEIDTAADAIARVLAVDERVGG